MDYSVLKNSVLFSGMPAADLRIILEKFPHRIQCYDKGETVFHIGEEANRISGEMIGPAAVFSTNLRYP